MVVRHEQCVVSVPLPGLEVLIVLTFRINDRVHKVSVPLPGLEVLIDAPIYPTPQPGVSFSPVAGIRGFDRAVSVSMRIGRFGFSPVAGIRGFDRKNNMMILGQ